MTRDMGGPDMAPLRPPALGSAPAEPWRSSMVIAVVKDLFFVARIRETARLTGVPLAFARSPEELTSALAAHPRLVLLDLTAGFDYEKVFAALPAGVTNPGRAAGARAAPASASPW
jgi:hypothetical protein